MILFCKSHASPITSPSFQENSMGSFSRRCHLHPRAPFTAHDSLSPPTPGELSSRRVRCPPPRSKRGVTNPKRENSDFTKTSNSKYAFAPGGAQKRERTVENSLNSTVFSPGSNSISQISPRPRKMDNGNVNRGDFAPPFNPLPLLSTRNPLSGLATTGELGVVVRQLLTTACFVWICARMCFSTSSRSCQPAICRAVIPASPLMLVSAFFLRRASTTFTCPALLATMRGELPTASCLPQSPCLWSGNAPIINNSSTTSTFPSLHATVRGVFPMSSLVFGSACDISSSRVA
mmetsp:Transcript_31721/g.46389  ORF Transcript_31721/g.46389 Transcript_31721/m.46389 type:complete len:291 (-) Transcript_31721:270-1142(-)